MAPSRFARNSAVFGGIVCILLGLAAGAACVLFWVGAHEDGLDGIIVGAVGLLMGPFLAVLAAAAVVLGIVLTVFGLRRPQDSPVADTGCRAEQALQPDASRSVH